MHTITSTLPTLAGACFALALTAAAASAQTELGKADFVSGCEAGALGLEQTNEACTCAYDFLTGEASDIVREAMFIRVRDGQDAQSTYLDSQAEGNEDLMTQLAAEAEQLIGDCGLTDE